MRFDIYNASIRWMLSAFHKVQWLHFTGEVDTFIIVWCNISLGFCTPKITKISSFFTELFFLENQGVIAFFETLCRWEQPVGALWLYIERWCKGSQQKMLILWTGMHSLNLILVHGRIKFLKHNNQATEQFWVHMHKLSDHNSSLILGLIKTKKVITN